MTSSKIRKRALRDPQLALKDMFLKGRRDEQSTYQAKDIESEDVKDAETNIIATQQRQKTEQQTCRNCGRGYPHDGRCPATLLMNVTVQRRNLQENIGRENQSLGQSDLCNKKIITRTQILTSHTYTP